MTAVDPNLPPALVERLSTIRSVGVITGAGISQEAGIPTYRGKGGIYDDPDEGDRTVEALTGDTLRRDPDRTWRAVAALARHTVSAAPTAAHRALVDLERAIERVVILTQNVDGLHQLAGSRNVIAIHGNALETECLGCGRRGLLSPETLRSLEAAPRCSTCGAIERPAVVLFGELLPDEPVARMRQEFLEDVPELLLAVGTSALFPYIVEPIHVGRVLGRLTVEVNPEESLVSPLCDYALRGAAGAYVPLIVEAITSARRDTDARTG